MFKLTPGQIARATAELSEQAASDKEPLPEKEWNFFGDRVVQPLTWQMNHWLNYEYARSSRSIVEAVQQLRERKIATREVGTLPDGINVPRLAVYLKDNYPEFPEQPWHELPKDQRRRRAREVAGGVDQDPFEKNALTVYDSFDFCRQIAIGEISLDSCRISDEEFCVLKIDFTKGDKLIEKKFRQLLQRRRQELEEKYENEFVSSGRSGKEVSLAESFKVKRATANVGQHNNRRVYVSWMKRLAALRLLKHYGIGNWGSAAEETKKVSGKYLYSYEQTPWRRAAEEALELFKRFEVAWKYALHPAFLLRPNDYHGSLFAPSLAGPLIKKTKSKSKPSPASNSTRQECLTRFLQNNFVDFTERK